MALSCDYDYELEPGSIAWYTGGAWLKYDFKRAPKCCSCGTKLKDGGFGKDALVFHRFKVPEHDIEIAIYGEDGEIPRANWYMCFECGWRYRVLEDAGYAVNIEDDMCQLFIEHESLKELGQAGCLG